MSHKPTSIPLCVFILFLLGNNVTVMAQLANLKSKKVPFAGTWSYGTDKYDFSITIAQTADSIKGTYCAASQKWADCWESGANYCIISGTTRFDTAVIVFNSNFSNEDSKRHGNCFLQQGMWNVVMEAKIF